MRCIRAALLLAALVGLASGAALKALLIDGPEWQPQTAAIKALLESNGLFQVDVLSSPAKASDAAFQPQFERYKLVVLNFGGEGWPVTTLAAFDKYLQNGGGVVALAAAGGAFPAWPEYNLIIGLSQAPNRNEMAGPFWFYKDGNLVYDSQTRGPAGKVPHPDQPFQITIRNTEHPITKGLPLVWMHAGDELQGNLRGPGKNMSVLATARSAEDRGGTGRDEPQLLAITYGKGRVFHTFLGHGPEGIDCVGFAVTLQRGGEWAATGKVTQKIPADFPGEEKVSMRSAKVQGAAR